MNTSKSIRSVVPSRRRVMAQGASCVAVAVLGAAAHNADATPSPGPWPWAAPHSRQPTIENPGNGPILASPRVVPIVYRADPQAAALAPYFTKLATST